MKQQMTRGIRCRRKRKTSKRKKRSSMAIIVLTILGIVLLGDILGAIIYVRQTPVNQIAFMQYVNEGAGNHLTFFEIFWQQAMYQLTIWGLGLTIIGNLVNAFLLFARGVSMGFNLAFMMGASSDLPRTSTLLLWLLPSLLILFTTLLSVYFSVRFAYIVVKSLAKKKYKLIKKQLKRYVTQLAVVLIFSIFTSMVTAVTMPRITTLLTDHDALNTMHLEAALEE